MEQGHPRLDKLADLLSHYRDAVQRFHAAAKAQDREPAIGALVQALTWAVSLDEYIAAHWNLGQAKKDWGWRERVS